MYNINMKNNYFARFVLIITVALLFVQSVNAAELMHSAWIPRWSPLSGEVSVKRNSELFEEISPMWYKVNPDGSLYYYETSNAGSLKRLLKKNKIKLIPTVAMFDYKVINEVFSTQENFERHLNSIISEVEKYDYDGIDLDYESILESDKEKFFEFLMLLAAKLDKMDKSLSVTVLAKWGDDVVYSFPQTRNVQDWSRIGKYADQVRIMAYDYTYTGSVHPGPIGPLSWHGQILEYAITKLPKDKIVMGIPLYAYQWRREATDDFFSKEIADIIRERNFSTAAGFVHTGVLRLMSENEGVLEEYEGEKFFRYQSSSVDGKREDVVLVFADTNSVGLRQQLAKEYGIRGVTYWSLGGEEDLLDSRPTIEIETEVNNEIVEISIELIKQEAKKTLGVSTTR